MTQPSLSVVIPAFNEASRLPRTLVRIGEYLQHHREWLPAEVVVVDDGSRDGTAVAAQAVSFPVGVQLVVVQFPQNRGKGAAVRGGMEVSKGKWVLLCDADLATPMEELAALAAAGAAVAVGSRALRRELIGRRQPWWRDLLGRAFNLWLRLLGLTALRDTQCGFKLLEGELARSLAKSLQSDGFFYDVELLWQAQQLGAAVVEVPVRWFHVEGSQVHTFRHGLAMAWEAWRFFWRTRAAPRLPRKGEKPE